MSTVPNANGGSNMQLAALAFSGLAGAKARIDANYERPGMYWERIDKLKLDMSRKNEVFLAVEKTVIHVWDEKLADQKPGKRGHIVGEAVTHMMMKKHDSFLGNVKSMIANVMGLTPEQVQEGHALQICGDDQPLTGTVIEVENRNITTRKGGDFTAINYRREVPASEVLAQFTKMGDAGTALKERFFPGNYLERVVEAERAAQSQAQPPAAAA